MSTIRQLAASTIVINLVEKLRRKCEKEGTAVAAVGKALGLSRMQAHRLLKQNEPPTPTIETAQKIAEYLGLELKIELVTQKGKRVR